jgi:hypothetical protein
MQTMLIIVGGWIALSCTLGPLLAWAFFYSERRAKSAEAALDHQIATGPTVTLAPDLLTGFSHELRQTQAVHTHDAQ